jgi:hypothetical protein
VYDKATTRPCGISLQGRLVDEPGDPALAGQAVVEGVESANAPTRFLLGKDTCEQALRKLEAMRSEFEAWKEATCATHFAAFAESA